MARLYADEIDFAYFAVNLGWDLEQYGSCTPVQLLFIRKEIERKTVRESNLLKDAVQVAVANCLGKRKHKLWVKKAGRYVETEFSEAEIDALTEELRKNTPWTPWNKKGGVPHG